MNIVHDTLSGLTLGKPVIHKQMAMFPLLNGAAAQERYYLTLNEALDSDLAKVSEVSESGSVPELSFKNLGDKPVLLVEGEELVGAKQNRTLNISILAPAGKEIPIPVSCVERGRWGYDEGRSFSHSDRSHFARGRRGKIEGVNRNIREAPHSRSSDQGEVWGTIDRKMARMRASSVTDSMSDIYEQNRGTVDSYVSAFKRKQDQVGAVFLVGDGFAGIDLFAHDSAFEKVFPKLVRSYALDAMELPAAQDFQPSQALAGKLLADLNGCGMQDYPAVGEGRDVRIESEGIAGAALVAADEVLHLAAFRREQAGGHSGSRGNYRRAGSRQARYNRATRARDGSES